MRDVRRLWQSALLGALLALVLAGSLWAPDGDAATALLVGASAWPFIAGGVYVVLRYRHRDADEARQRAGITTDDEWRTVRRAVAGKDVPSDARLRREAVRQLRRSAGTERTFVVLAVTMTALALLQTALAFDGGSRLTAVLSWFVVATGVAQVWLTRTHRRRADVLEHGAAHEE